MTTPYGYAEIIDGWYGRPVFGLVDLDALGNNIAVLRHIIGPDVRLMAVVKANGYGHGAVAIGREALAAGADLLAVATVDEAAQLRRVGIDTELMVLGAIGKAELGRAISLKLGIVSSSPEFLKAIVNEAKITGQKEPVAVHLKIDSGMRRFGAMPVDVVDLARAIVGHPELRFASAMTHLAAADDPDETSAFAQAQVMDDCLDPLADAGIEVPPVHIANSAATLRFPELYRDQVRVGIAMYGLRPDYALPLPDGMRPVMTIHGRITRVIDVKIGDRVGYGRTYTATRDHRAGLVSIGYADGYRRALSAQGWMAKDGQRLEVLGRISMDQTVVALPDDAIEQGDTVTIVGDGTGGPGGAPGLDELGKLAGTISYEMATGIAPRLPKLYIRGGALVGVGDLSGYREL